MFYFITKKRKYKVHSRGNRGETEYWARFSGGLTFVRLVAARRDGMQHTPTPHGRAREKGEDSRGPTTLSARISYYHDPFYYSIRPIISAVFDSLFTTFDHSFYLKISANIKKDKSYVKYF